jgi:hypothetical protein
MEEYILFKGDIEGKHKKVHIYPLNYSSYEYLVHWNSSEVGVIKKIDNKWYAEVDELISVVEEIGAYIDEHGVSPD